MAAELLADTFDLELPDFHQARLASGDLPELVPTEYRADAVVVLGKGDDPVLAVVVEVQLRRDQRKRFSWPVYLTSLRARLGCPTVLMTISLSHAIATWCAMPISLGHPGLVLTPLVLGPDIFPVMSDAADVVRNPELAVLSALAHPDHPETVTALLSGLATLDDAPRQFVH